MPGYIKKTIRFNEILSDELIDELNEQAAKQVLSKIQFIEKGNIPKSTF